MATNYMYSYGIILCTVYGQLVLLYFAKKWIQKTYKTVLIKARYLVLYSV